MTVLPIRLLGDPALRLQARPLADDEIADAETQRLIDDMIETKRAAHGAGLAANQVGDLRRIAIVEVEPGNPRYPYKPPFGLTVLINPRIIGRGRSQIEINEGCLSVPDLRGSVSRDAEIDVEYEDRDGRTLRRHVAGLSAGTFQHEIDHLDGILFLDRVEDTRTLATREMFDRHLRMAFERHARAVVAHYGS